MTQAEIEKYSRPDFFYNHGDNPAFKNMIALMQNTYKNGEIINTKSKVVERGYRFLNARNIDDFLQRDLKIHTAARAGVVLFNSTLFFITITGLMSVIIPVGRRGITKVRQTPFYQVFGGLGVAAGAAAYGLCALAYWKTLLFTTQKIWHVGVKGNKNFMWEATSQGAFHDYRFKDTPTASNEASGQINMQVFYDKEGFKTGYVKSPYASLQKQEQ